MKSARINARIPPEIKSALEEEASNQDCSESRIVFLALKKYLEAKK